jgi:lysophospholipase L1-like esterase
MVKRILGISGWVIAAGAIAALGVLVLEYRSLYIKERLTSLQMVPVSSPTKLPPDWEDGRTRVLMIGDSRIQQWPTLPESETMVFAISGIGGESTGQLERRFVRDALTLSAPPDMVIIAAGVNDLVAASTTETHKAALQEEILGMTTERLTGLAKQVREAGIDVRLATIIQAAEPDQVRRLMFWDDSLYRLVTDANTRLNTAASAEGIAVLDFNAALEGGDGPLPPRFARDTLHFTANAYQSLNDFVLNELSER